MRKGFKIRSEFGNVEQIKILEKERAEQEFNEKWEKCSRCKGEQTVLHDCDCELCETEEIECPECDGAGKFEK